MPGREPATDPYQRRRARAAQRRAATQGRLLTAADELFRTQGYTGTSVAAIAERAGVSLQTLYLAWGNKAALLRAATTAAAVGTRSPVTHEDWRASIRETLSDRLSEQAQAGEYLREAAALFVEVAARTATYWRIRREAAAYDPEVAAEVEATAVERRQTMEGVAKGVPAPGLRDDLGPDEVADTFWALASPELHDLFTRQLGRTDEEYGQWLTTTLLRALCTDESSRTALRSPGGRP